MAYIIGLLKPEEKAELERRGWEVEPAPKGIKTPTSALRDGLEYGMVFVDNGMLQIMSGSDWDKGPPKTMKVTISDVRVTEREVEIPTCCPKCGCDLTSIEEENLRVWEYADQSRCGFLATEENGEGDMAGINTRDTTRGGENFISNVSVWCTCGHELVSGRFEQIDARDAEHFLVETKHGNAWEMYEAHTNLEEANETMDMLLDRKTGTEVRIIRSKKTHDGVENSVVQRGLDAKK